jgi:hypothetical protein
MEQGWADFIEPGPSTPAPANQAAMEAHSAGFRILVGETLTDLLGGYDKSPAAPITS